MQVLGSLVLLVAMAAFSFGTRSGIAMALVLGSLGIYMVK